MTSTGADFYTETLRRRIAADHNDIAAHEQLSTMARRLPAVADDWRDEYDWREAFKYASKGKADGYKDEETEGPRPSKGGCDDISGFGIKDVCYVAAKVEGENDGDSWLMVGRLFDGRWFVLDALCDYTGWG